MTDTRPPQTPPFAKGRTAEVYRRGEGEVLKLFYDWVPDSWIEREMGISRALTGGSLPVPRFIEAVTTNGRRGLVFERINRTVRAIERDAHAVTLGLSQAHFVLRGGQVAFEAPDLRVQGHQSVGHLQVGHVLLLVSSLSPAAPLSEIGGRGGVRRASGVTFMYIVA